MITNEDFKKMKDRVKEADRKKDLQVEINKLSRMIDKRFGYLCIDCEKPFGEQTDAAHFFSIGSHAALRYNLHNIHSARAFCNKYSNTHKEGYTQGLEVRYGKDYKEKVIGLIKEFPYLGKVDVKEKLKIVRKIIREFEVYEFKDGSEGREMFNRIIGIYE